MTAATEFKKVLPEDQKIAQEIGAIRTRNNNQPKIDADPNATV